MTDIAIAIDNKNIFQQDIQKDVLQTKSVKEIEKNICEVSNIKKNVSSEEEKSVNIKDETKDVIQTKQTSDKLKQEYNCTEIHNDDISLNIVNKEENNIKTHHTAEKENIVNEVSTVHKINQNQNVTKESSINKKSTKISTSNLLAEQRAYVIGLQTIPNIKGRIHSSYHYDLLLKTFFIHLTDVMVALSRFILTDKPLSKSNSSENISQDINETTKSTTNEEITTITKANNLRKNEINLQEKSEDCQLEFSNITNKVVNTNNLKENISINEVSNRLNKNEENEVQTVEVQKVNEEKKISGSRMAQLTEKKSEELMQKMDAVVSEFQSKTEHEELFMEDKFKQDVRTEVISKDIDPLEWLSKIDESKNVEESSNEQEIKATMIQKNVKDTKVNNFKSVQSIKHAENLQTSRETIAQAGNTKTYVAIVEAHVYTNKDAILEDNSLGISQQSTNITEQAKEEKIEQETQIINEICSEQNVIQEETEITLEEAMAKSNIAIITCEPINKNLEVNEDKIVINSKSELTNAVLENINIKSQHETDVNFTDKEESTSKFDETFVKSAEDTSYLNNFESISIGTTENNLEVINLKSQECRQHNLEEVEKMAAEYEQENLLYEKSLQEESKHTVEETYETVQESSFTAKSVNILNNESSKMQVRKLSLNIDRQDNVVQPSLDTQLSIQSDENNNIETPTPTTIPPTPLTDEYVFRLDLPLVESTVAPADETPTPEEHEDPHIVKKKLIPHIDTTIESVVYDEPLATPIATNIIPAFIQHGLDTTEEKNEANKAVSKVIFLTLL